MEIQTRKRKHSLSKNQFTKTKKLKFDNTPSKAALIVAQNVDLMLSIFRFLPARQLVKMMEVCQLWCSVARDGLIWRRLCEMAWPKEIRFVETLREIVGDYWKTFETMYCIKEKCPPTTLRKGGGKKRFTLENLLVYIQVFHCGEVIWTKTETGESLFGNVCLDMEEPLPIFTCSIERVTQHLSIKLSFILNDPVEKTIWISDRILVMENSYLYLTNEGFRVIGSEFDDTEEQFLGVLRLVVDEGDTVGLRLTLKGVLTFFLSKGKKTGLAPITDRYVLGFSFFLCNNSLWFLFCLLFPFWFRFAQEKPPLEKGVCARNAM